MSKRPEITQRRYDDIVAHMTREVDGRVERLRQRALMQATSLRMRLGLELSAFPMEVRQMTLRQFCADFDGNVSQFFTQQGGGDSQRRDIAQQKETAGGVECSDTGKLATPGRLRQARQTSHPYSPAVYRSAVKHNSLAVSQTPRLNPMLPETPAQKSRSARHAQRHESILSVNGSPLLNPYTGDDLSRRSTRIMAARESNILSVPILRGQEATELTIDLSAQIPKSPLRALDSPAKRQVQNHIEMLQRQLQDLMESIK